MSHEIIFYTNPQSRGRIVRWMLEELGVPYETRVEEYGKSMKSEAYLQVNPMGKVPSLVHKGQVITECAAICAYLADVYPDAGLLPPIESRGAYYRWLFFTAGPVEAAITDRNFGWEVSPEKKGTVGYGDYKSTMDVLAKAVGRSTYVAGETFSAADVYIGSQVGWGLQFKTMPERKELKGYWERLQQREALQRASQLDDELLSRIEKK